MPVVLIIDDEEAVRESLQLILEDRYTTLTAINGKEAIEIIEKNDVDIVLLDLSMPVMDGRETLDKLKAIVPDVDVVVVTALNDVKEAVGCIRQGAYDYITKPFEPDEILSTTSRIIEKQRLKNEVEYLRSEIERIWGFGDIITRNQKMLEIFRIIKNVAPASTSVLITGESGTGKELIARCIHKESPRCKEPFVAVNCAAIPPELMESEFFGHEKGAFTGAYTKMMGKFEYANGGTIFLDEISSLRLDLQAKLLRVLQDMEITRIGSLKPIKVDVRLITAT
ncbi:MAG: sigma-54 dependent transcriptional regulator, partial [Nitrospirota bacterium]